MTQPVFSDRETDNLRKLPKKVCANCKGRGRVVGEVPTRFYPCGYATYAMQCADCKGTGFVDPNQFVPDYKKNAGGDQ